MKKEENKSQIIIYQTESGETKIDVRFQDETIWLTQKLMAELFQTTIPNVNIHITNIFDEGELDKNSTIKDFLIVQKEGNREVNRKQKFYNLDVIISVGYRIKSHIATKFRQWATKHLREYMVKGFVLDNERLNFSFIVFFAKLYVTALLKIIKTEKREKQIKVALLLR